VRKRSLSFSAKEQKRKSKREKQKKQKRALLRVKYIVPALHAQLQLLSFVSACTVGV